MALKSVQDPIYCLKGRARNVTTAWTSGSQSDMRLEKYARTGALVVCQPPADEMNATSNATLDGGLCQDV